MFASHEARQRAKRWVLEDDPEPFELADRYGLTEQQAIRFKHTVRREIRAKIRAAVQPELPL